jgi:hypothetical protein
MVKHIKDAPQGKPELDEVYPVFGISRSFGLLISVSKNGAGMRINLVKFRYSATNARADSLAVAFLKQIHTTQEKTRRFA